MTERHDPDSGRGKRIRQTLLKDATTFGIGLGGSMAILNSIDGQPVQTAVGGAILVGSGVYRLILEQKAEKSKRS